MKVVIINGSVYGSAERLAQTVSEFLTSLGHDVVFNIPPTTKDLVQAEAVLVVTSTTGHGEVPNNLLPFYLEARDTMPLISGKPFGVICLGDSSYPEFGGAGDKMQELMFELQGTEPLAMLKIDALETLEPEESALEWLDDWLVAIDA